MKRWHPRQELSRAEQIIIKRLKRTRKLFAFLRENRHVIFDDEFQEELEGMYRQTGAGDEPIPPAQLCLAIVLQSYHGVSDAEAVELTIMDRRWQMVLDCMNAEEPAFAQGTLQKFRERLIAADMDRRLLERTRDVASKTGAFDWRKLPKEIKAVIDSRPLIGAGRVEDTFNLLGHAARKVAQCAAKLMGLTFEEICQRAGMPLLLNSSIKAALDINWSDPEQKEAAIELLVAQIASLHSWIVDRGLLLEEPLTPYIEAIAQIQRQDLERDRNGRVRIARGVAEERRVSIEDPEMRHGRKSDSRVFNGFKEHILADQESGLILACAITPANRPEAEAAEILEEDVAHQKLRIVELLIDRGYVSSPLVERVRRSGGKIICKAWHAAARHTGLFTKLDFKLDLRSKMITCPAGETRRFGSGKNVKFGESCQACPLRKKCTRTKSRTGRTVSIARDEVLQRQLRKLEATKRGRARLRERTAVEHRLAHVAARKGPRARYKGVRRNLFDLRRAAVVQNLETVQRRLAA